MPNPKFLFQEILMKYSPFIPSLNLTEHYYTLLDYSILLIDLVMQIVKLYNIFEKMNSKDATIFQTDLSASPIVLFWHQIQPPAA